jgi:2-isopropylmalate synthase
MGAKRAIIHLYNSTSPAQRRIVFGLEKSDIVKIAVLGTRWIKERAPRLIGTEVMFQYSPESFSATETDFALEVCEAVMAEWQPTTQKKMILNLPDTVEVAMCNVYADQIEWFCRQMKHRDRVIISVHTHNDRGTGVAATELAMLAGAERVEGTLFGNGERTGNLDIVTVALNLYTQGVAPGLDFSHISEVRHMYERCTGMTVPPRQPYGGDLVFTAFSGSHQDAIKKGLAAMKNTQPGTAWDVPYLVIDPSDLGREYREVIRVNSQSGKGGIAYLLEEECGLILPKTMQREFGPLANIEVDRLGREVTAAELKAMFWKEYIERVEPYTLHHFHADGVSGQTACRTSLVVRGEPKHVTGEGNGPIAAFVQALVSVGAPAFEVTHYSEHALGSGATATAIAYIQIKTTDGRQKFGAGVDTSIELASIRAVLSALNRLD